ncbi:MAG: ATP-binding protein [Bacteroidota bacterium]
MRKNRVYLVAILVTITVILVNQAFIQYWLYQKREDAKLINMGGRQRMLSQRLLAQVLIRQVNPATVSPTDLHAIYQEWYEAHQRLSDSFRGNTFSNRRQKEIFAQLVALEPYFQFCQRYLEQAATGKGNTTVRQLQFNQESFLGQMDDIVSIMEADSQRKLLLVITIEIIFALISLFMIYYEIRFVFQRINDDLAGKNASLVESNYLLEQYAYLAAHDLRSPAQNILNFTRVLRKRLGDRLQEKEVGYFDFIQDAAQRLRQTTDDLLQFSSINNQQLRIERVDPTVLIEAVLRDLESDLQDREARVEMDAFPASIRVDRHLLHLVFQNLLSNGIKFVAPETPPEVRIGYQDDGPDHVFTIRDNGIGIDENNVDKIFGLFKRLHSHTQYNGTGIGLSICQKVVEKHGGEISVDSEPTVGSTFIVRLPKTPVA